MQALALGCGGTQALDGLRRLAPRLFGGGGDLLGAALGLAGALALALGALLGLGERRAGLRDLRLALLADLRELLLGRRQPRGLGALGLGRGGAQALELGTDGARLEAGGVEVALDFERAVGVRFRLAPRSLGSGAQLGEFAQAALLGAGGRGGGEALRRGLRTRQGQLAPAHLPVASEEQPAGHHEPRLRCGGAREAELPALGAAAHIHRELEVLALHASAPALRHVAGVAGQRAGAVDLVVGDGERQALDEGRRASGTARPAGERALPDAVEALGKGSWGAGPEGKHGGGGKRQAHGIPPKDAP